LYAGSRINVVMNRITVYTIDESLKNELLVLPQYRNILAVTREHNPVFVGVYIDIERNNVVITLYDGHNAEYIVDVRQFDPIFDRFLARMRATNEEVFVTTELGYRHNQNYHLLPWTSHVEHNNIEE
ncbi:5220_t:CDS:2, partial [Racocetra persica]